jgi:hypothetical protein
MFPPGRGRLVTNPLPTGSDTQVKTIGMERVAFSAAETTELVETKMTSGQAHNFLGHGAHTFFAIASEPVVEANVAPVCPAELL